MNASHERTSMRRRRRVGGVVAASHRRRARGDGTRHGCGRPRRIRGVARGRLRGPRGRRPDHRGVPRPRAVAEDRRALRRDVRDRGGRAATHCALLARDPPRPLDGRRHGGGFLAAGEPARPGHRGPRRASRRRERRESARSRSRAAWPAHRNGQSTGPGPADAAAARKLRRLAGRGSDVPAPEGIGR